MSDTVYNRRAGYLKEQEHFQSNDFIREEIVPLQRWMHSVQESSMCYSQFGLQVMSGLGVTGYC